MSLPHEKDKLSFIWLSDKPEWAAIAAHWSYTEWYLNRKIPFDINLKAYRQRAKNQSIPVTRMVCMGDFPVGMASLKENDLWSRKDLNPWLASVYILPQFRGRGLGSKLIQEMAVQAQSFSIENLYLFLGQSEQKQLSKLYQRAGWKFFDTAIDNDNLPTQILIKQIL